MVSAPVPRKARTCLRSSRTKRGAQRPGSEPQPTAEDSGRDQRLQEPCWVEQRRGEGRWDQLRGSASVP